VTSTACFFIVKQSHTTGQKDIYFLSTLCKRYGTRYKLADDVTITAKVFRGELENRS
jgi:hypothetical protein